MKAKMNPEPEAVPLGISPEAVLRALSGLGTDGLIDLCDLVKAGEEHHHDAVLKAENERRLREEQARQEREAAEKAKMRLTVPGILNPFPRTLAQDEAEALAHEVRLCLSDKEKLTQVMGREWAPDGAARSLATRPAFRDAVKANDWPSLTLMAYNALSEIGAYRGQIPNSPEDRLYTLASIIRLATKWAEKSRDR